MKFGTMDVMMATMMTQIDLEFKMDVILLAGYSLVIHVLDKMERLHFAILIQLELPFVVLQICFVDMLFKLQLVEMVLLKHKLL